MIHAIQAALVAAIIGACILLGLAPTGNAYEVGLVILAAILLRAWAVIADQREEVLALRDIVRSLSDDVALHDRKRGQA
jgi:hypothetical protein